VPGADSGATANCDFDVLRRGTRWKLELLPHGTGAAQYGAPHCAWKGVLNGATVSVSLAAKTTSVTDGKWHKITCARTTGGEQIVVDGTVKATSKVALGSIDTSAKIFVARNPDATDYYQGSLDDFAFTVG
jgi:hypothetical protein